MENAEELKERLTSLSFEVVLSSFVSHFKKPGSDEISEKIYKIISDLTTQSTRIAIAKRYKYWF
jgi:hypothetical protein